MVFPKGKGKFPANRQDWKWWHDSVPDKLKELHKNGYRVVIFSNQAGVEKGKQKVGDLTGKILDMCKEVTTTLNESIRRD